MRSSLVVCAVFLGLVGCADRTAILVEVTSADLSVPIDVDAITIRAQSEFGSTFERTYPLSASWPHSLTLLPASQEGIGGVRIDVTGSLRGAFVVRRVILTEFVPGTVRPVSAVLSRACAGVSCPDGIDCLLGRCIDPDAPDGGHPDAGLDAGGLDAPGLDAPMSMPDGGEDAPGTDAPELDAPMSTTDAPMSMPDAGMDAGMPDAPPPVDAGRDAPPGTDAPVSGPLLYISEYTEGAAGQNKAIEIYNAGTTTIDLTTCRLNMYANGSVTATGSMPMSGSSVAPGGVFVLCHGSVDAALLAQCDVPLGPSGGALAFNGDDALELVCGGVRMDVIGQIGTDPGTEWGTGATSTADATIRRLCTVTAGDLVSTDAFDPTLEWLGTASATDYSGFGMRGCP